MANYKYENRSVYEQILNITPVEKQILYNLLIENYKPENRSYRYDFFKDNCSTRIRDILQKAMGEKLHFSSKNTNGNKTFRQLIYPYLENMSWSKFGIDILLGMPTDAKASDADYMFLPDELMKNVDTTTIDGKRFAEKPVILYQAHKAEKSSLPSPNLVFAIFMIIVVGLTLWEFYALKKGKHFNLKIFDRAFFLILALLSLLIILMWIFSLHYPVRGNLNVLWLNPLYFYVFLRLEKSNFYILAFCILCNLLVLCGQYFLPQHFNTAFYAIVIVAILRLMVMIFRKRKLNEL
jgi:hypothetical protein